MRRREFIVLLGGAAVLVSTAVADEKKAKIGFLSWFSPSTRDRLDQFRQGMQQFGRIEGKDYEVEAHFTSGSAELTEQIARKLAQEPVDVLVVITTTAVRIAREATHTIPIVMEASNALADGLVPSLSHPGGNLTGVSLLVSDLVGKRLELLREFRPNLHAVAFLGAARASSTATFVHETQAAADRLGVALSVRLVDGTAVIDQTLFDAIKKDGNEAVIVSALFLGQEDRIVAMARQARLPVVADFAAFTEAGALLSYGINEPAQFRRVAYYVDRILKGAKPADLPVEQPTEFELVLNARTAAELGWTIPQNLLAQADRVIE
jgi:putative ABC transport system substrate-binding protein